MTIRIGVIVMAVYLLIPALVKAVEFDFQDYLTIQALVSIDPNEPLEGPGIFPTSSAWTGYYEPISYLNNGVTLSFSGFPQEAVPGYFPAYIPPSPYLGMPAFVLGQSISTNCVGTFSLKNIPAAPAGDTYELALYSSNFWATAATSFSLISGSGVPDKGISEAVNAMYVDQTSGPDNQFEEGVNYVLFNDVVPDGGTVSVTATPLFGEADLSAVQLVSVPLPEPASIAMALISWATLLVRRRERRGGGRF